MGATQRPAANGERVPPQCIADITARRTERWWCGAVGIVVGPPLDAVARLHNTPAAAPAAASQPRLVP